ncbi:MAG TPA: beta-ketoacyl synthase N-terminal-like domain-containing protein, partial [Isosphaeraceae bacterium]
MTGQLPRMIALAPGGTGGIAAAVAAARAGALGMLDLERADPGSTREAVARAAGLADGLAVRIGAGSVSDDWLAALPREVRAVCCIADEASDWAAALGRVARSGRIALAEVTTRDDARRAADAGASGVILAGHEAGGNCSDESSFILLQAVAAEGRVPAWVRGGIGLLSAAGCVAAGASGVVLDGALLLAKESPLDEAARAAIARFDGSETVVIPRANGTSARVFHPKSAPARAADVPPRNGDREDPGPGTRNPLGWAPGCAWPVGQDSAFAAALARKYATVGGIVRAVEEAIDHGIVLARETGPLGPDSPLARSHGTRYPIVQGPMTRVSDTVAFAAAVAEGGALPFLALAMLRGPEVRALLEDASQRLEGRPWGVGVLGFVTPELRREQVEAVRLARPPFALIAGGRPDQARELENEGIRTYLHVPSPGLLAHYLKDGARRFVLEGRECGGHVGPRSSLVLWEQAAAMLLEFADRGGPTDDLHVLFAGGIHDARSAAAVAAIAAPLAARGVKVGVLIGTAYLFTQEAVSTGAIVPRFQAEAVNCRRTVLLETGPGHEVRVAPSPFAESFADARRRMIAAGKTAERVRADLEAMNAGRLRVAAKGVDRADGTGSPLVSVAEPEQFERGIYMLGQAATLRERVTTIAELHREIGEGSTGLLRAAQAPRMTAPPPARPSDIAIVGLSAIFPGAADARTFWENTLKGVDAIVEIPPDRWDWRTYYDADPKAPDKVVSKWGGFVPDVPFDPLRYGMPPSSLPSIEPVQLLVLEAVRRALDDAGYVDRPFPRERTAVVLGMGGGAAQLAMGYAFRSYLPMLEAVAPEAGKAAREASEPLLPEWTEDSFPGFLLNVAAGRVANRFDLGGSNYTVDAACGSSLAAASLAVRELETGAADMVILGGADTVQNPLSYLAFSKTHAFSPRGRCRPFDASADGIVISEGVGVVVLKRLADAERDGDRIYAVIKGMGSSSDGRAKGLTAPNEDGQARALERAYEKSGVDPGTLGYVEAHGTGTAVGDVVEVNALAGALRKAGAAPASCAVGSVKSMIGHTKCAAGIAGLINASLALYHRTLPPTIGVERINAKADLADGPLRVSTKARPWFHADRSRPRRAGVSAFGFGGTNFHAVLEGYDRDPLAAPSPIDEWPAELLLWREETPGEIQSSLEGLIRSLDRGARPRLRDLARTLGQRFDATAKYRPTLAIVATTLDDLRGKLATAREALAADRADLDDPRGIYYAARPAFAGAGVAFLFPGQGSQSLEMLGDLALTFPEVREAFETFDGALLADGHTAITPLVFPPTTLDDAAREQARRVLTATDIAQPAVGAASVGMLRLLRSLGVDPDAVAGHSYGELVALHAAGCLSAESLATLSEARGRLMRDAA